jgi:hypothetical protein
MHSSLSLQVHRSLEAPTRLSQWFEQRSVLDTLYSNEVQMTFSLFQHFSSVLRSTSLISIYDVHVRLPSFPSPLRQRHWID